MIQPLSFRASSWFVLFAVFIFGLYSSQADSVPAKDQKIAITPWSTAALPASTHGGFAGKTSTHLLIAASSQKNPGTLSVWSVPVPSNSEAWKESTVSVPSWSAAAAWSNSVVVVGGLKNGQPTNQVSVLETDAQGNVSSRDLPPLPQAVVGAGAAMIGDMLYVFGGASSVEPTVFENTLWKLDLSKGVQGAQWLKGEAFPGAGRAFFGATEQYGMLCVFGGVVAGDKGSAATADTWIYRPKPIEGTTFVGWQKMSPLPAPLTHAFAIPIGQASVVLMGGHLESDVATLLPEVGALGKNQKPQLYHTITDAWCSFDREVPISDAVPVKYDASVMVVGGNSVPSQEITFPRTVRNLAVIDYIVIVGYFLLLAGIGFYFAKQESSEEFSLGNRQVKWWAAGISMFATGASAISFMAIPALAFATNYVWTLPLLMVIPGYFVCAHLIFPLLRKMEITSTYEYLERRFNSPLRLIASAQCIIIQTFGRTAVVLVLPALAIAAVTGMNVYLSVILMGLLTTIYTSVGGFESVIWTEVFQGILKFVAPIAMVIIAIVSLPGGFGEFVKTSQTYHKLDFAIVSWDVTVPAFWILMIGSILAATIGKAGDQPIIQRVFSSPIKEVRRIAAMEAACGILIGLVVNTLGIAIFSYFRAHPAQFAPTAQNDQIVPLFVTQGMPAGFAGVVIAAIFASAMATVASAMNSVATIYTEDFYPLIKPGATDQQRLRTLKITSYVVGVVGTSMALLLAATNPKSLMVLWSQIVSLMGGGIVGVYSLGMFTKRVNGFGAVCGALFSIVCTLLVKLYTPLHWATYMPIAILSCMAFGYLCSLFSKQTKDLTGLTIYTPKKAD